MNTSQWNHNSPQPYPTSINITLSWLPLPPVTPLASAPPPLHTLSPYLLYFHFKFTLATTKPEQDCICLYQKLNTGLVNKNLFLKPDSNSKRKKKIPLLPPPITPQLYWHTNNYYCYHLHQYCHVHQKPRAI